MSHESGNIDDDEGAQLQAISADTFATSFKTLSKLAKELREENERVRAENATLRELLVPPNTLPREIATMRSARPLNRSEGAAYDTQVIMGTPPRKPFLPDRLIISPSGTSNGDADWIVKDLKIDGESVMIYPDTAGIPGDMFRSGEVRGGTTLEDFVRFTVCKESIEITVTYIGETRAGCVFCGALLGYLIDDPDQRTATADSTASSPRS